MTRRRDVEDVGCTWATPAGREHINCCSLRADIRCSVHGSDGVTARCSSFHPTSDDLVPLSAVLARHLRRLPHAATQERPSDGAGRRREERRRSPAIAAPSVLTAGEFMLLPTFPHSRSALFPVPHSRSALFLQFPLVLESNPQISNPKSRREEGEEASSRCGTA